MFSTRRRVEFRDTDAAGIVHFSAFFPMVEAAEHEFLRSLGIAVLVNPVASKDVVSKTVGDEAEPPAVTWPRVAASCDYRSAARFEDILEIEVTVLRLGKTSVQYGFRIFRLDADKTTEIAQAQMTAVCCMIEPGGHLTKTPIPESVRERLEKHN